MRSAALAGAVALVAGGGVGYAVSLTGSSGQKVVATAPLSGSGSRSSGQYLPTAGAASVPAMAVPGGFQLTPLLNRRANGVDIRGFLIDSGKVPPEGATTACADIGPRFQAELSTQKMVGIAGSGFTTQQTGPTFLSDQPSVLGEAEGYPVAVVVAQTGSSVSEVRMAFTGGATDTMEPVKGWSVLVAPMPGLQAGQANLGTLSALDSSGHTLASTPITWPPTPMPPLSPQRPSYGGSSGSGTGSSGTGSSGTGSSGTAIAGSAGSGIAYPCAVPAPMPVPLPISCVPPTTVQGQVYACPTQAPASEPTSTAPKGSGG